MVIVPFSESPKVVTIFPLQVTRRVAEQIQKQHALAADLFSSFFISHDENIDNSTMQTNVLKHCTFFLDYFNSFEHPKENKRNSTGK